MNRVFTKALLHHQIPPQPLPQPLLFTVADKTSCFSSWRLIKLTRYCRSGLSQKVQKSFISVPSAAVVSTYFVIPSSSTMREELHRLWFSETKGFCLTTLTVRAAGCLAYKAALPCHRPRHTPRTACQIEQCNLPVLHRVHG